MVSVEQGGFIVESDGARNPVIPVGTAKPKLGLSSSKLLLEPPVPERIRAIRA